MKRNTWLHRFLLFLILILSLSNCIALAEAPPKSSENQSLLVTSQSITAQGRLLTLTAANQKPNSPRGENQSPQLSFTPVEGATVYAILMFDTDASWLHWAVTDVTETELSQGQYTNKKQYIGPYPPKGSGEHHYRIEVFALKASPDKPSFRMNNRNNYEKIVASLDKANGEDGNILQRGSVEGLYQHKDDTLPQF